MLEDVYPLSPLQQGLYYHWLHAPSSPVHFIQLCYRLKGAMEIDQLEKSYRLLVNRHAVLRTFFTHEFGDTLLQVVQKDPPLGFVYEDVSGREHFSVEDYRLQDRERGFDLHRGSQMRLMVLGMGEDTYEFIWSFHHILMDGWCVSILTKEFFEIYHALLSGREPELSRVHAYSEYIQWLNRIEREEVLSYWQDYLSGYDTVSGIPRGVVGRAEQGYVGRKLEFSLGEGLRESIGRLCRETGVTENSFMQAVWGLLLSRYNDTDDVVFGSVVSGRPGELAGSEGMIGLFINTIPVRVRPRPEATVSELLREVQAAQVAGEGNHYVQLVDIQRETSLGRDLFDHIMVFENYPVEEAVESSMKGGEGEKEKDSALLSLDVFEHSNYDLAVTIFPAEGLRVRFNYNANLYEEGQFRRLGEHLLRLMEGFVKDPGAVVGEISCMGEAEQEQLLKGFNDTAVDFPKDKTIVRLFEERVKLDAEKVAVVYGETELNYRELNERSNRLAAYLRAKHGIGAGDLVGVEQDRSEWLIISILGILKAGGAYVPIDPGYPQERKDYMRQDSNCRVVVDEEELARFRSTEKEYSGMDPAPAAMAEDLAYVMYTSGSTGRPKGVMIEHRSVNRLIMPASYVTLTGEDVLLSTGAMSFDATTFEYWSMLLTGGRLIICPQETLLDARLLAKEISQRKVNIMWFTAGWLNQLVDTNIEVFNGLKLIIAGGDKLSPAHIDALLRKYPGLRIVNGYGPTENTTFSLTCEVLPMLDPIPIGRPISNSSAYILDGRMSLQPVGVAGEIYVGGAGLARGYLNRPDLTSARFVSHPWEPGERLYRTGDLGRWLSDGNIEFLGRCDEQVKIRGYRIEPGEIEHVIGGYEDVDGVVVVVRQGQEKEKELVAYVRSGKDLSVEELRKYVQGILPAYMIPAHFVQVAEFPLTSNGKVDKKRLPDPGGLELSSGVAYRAPRTRVETEVVEVYEEVLKRRPIGMGDDFFMLGGDSIKSIQIVSRLKQRGYTASIRDIMRYPVVEELCRQVKLSSRTIGQEIVEGRVSLGPIQEYFFENYGDTPHQYNQSVLLRFRGKVSEEGLRACLEKLVEHHDALRMVYYREGLDWVQENRGLEQGYVLEVLEGKSLSDLGEAADRLQSGIDIGMGPLFRAALWRIGDEEDDRVLLVAHHLVVDGVSWRILLEDLKLFYEQYQSGQPLSPVLKTDSFRHWQERLREYAQGRWAEKEDAYWSKVESEAVDVVVRDHAEGSNLTRDGVSCTFLLDEGQTEQLQTECYKAYRTEINDILLTGLGLSLEEVFGMRKILIGLEGHGREQVVEGVDTSRTVGWFTSMYPVVLDMGDSGEMVTRLIGVKERLHRVPNKGIGYGILRYIGRRDYRLEPEIIFNYLGDFGGGGEGQQQEELFTFSGEYHGEEVPEGLPRAAVLVVSGIVVGRRLRISIDYSREQYAPGTIEQLSSVFRQKLEALIGVLSKEEQTWLSPVDLTYKGLSIEELQLLDKDRRLQDVYTLSPLQQGLYYHWLHAPSSPVHFIQLCYRLKGVMEIDRLEKSYRLLVNRHAVLRTFFTHEFGDTLLQVVQKDPPLGFVYEDVSGREHFSVEDYRLQDRERGFDLNQGSQMRLTVLGMGDDSYEFIWSFHHILMDGWCVSILIKEFFEIYHASLSGREPELSRVHAYSEYIQWLSGVEREEVLDYWRNYLSGYDTVSGIPRGIADSAEQGYAAGELEFVLDAGLRESIGRLSRETGVTENSFMQAVWGLLLSRYNDTDDVVFGSVVSGRPGELAGSEEMIGLFINTIPVRVRLRPEATVGELLREVQTSLVAGEGNHYVQLADIQRETSLGRDLFDHIMVFENYPVEEAVESSMKGGEGAKEKEAELLSFGVVQQTNYDLMISVIPEAKFTIRFNYNTNLYDEEQIRRLEQQLVMLMEGFVKDPGAAVVAISCMGEAEQEQLLKGFNDTAADFPKDKTIVRLFEERVKLDAEKVAVVYGGTELTYRELNERSNRLAAYLRTKYDIGAGDLVAVEQDRSEWLVISILGILKAGGAYVPIDPGYPQERKDYMRQDSNCRAVVDEEELARFRSTEKEYSGMDPAPAAGAEDLVYVMYTSGSTGRPKGVMIEHRGIVNRLEWMWHYYGFTDKDIILQKTTFTFDVSVWELLLPLGWGCKMVLCSTEDIYSPDRIIHLIGTHRISCIHFVPTMLRGFMEGLNGAADNWQRIGSLTKIMTSGEALPADTVRSWYERSAIPIYNLYGPTEASIDVSYYDTRPASSRIPIGRPVANTQLYILDKDRRLTLMGAEGELYIGGIQLARGYLNRPDLTSARFVPHPWEPGERLYRTGDLGRWLSDGNIEFLGRCDEQVKIRGYRIELGEIEHVIGGYGHVDGVVVVVRQGQEKELVAYVRSGKALSVEELRGYVQGVLPAYMIPAHFVQVAEFPLTSNGKVDKKRLPDVGGLELSSGVAYQAPRTQVEMEVVEVYEEVLKRRPIGMGDDFFMLGGDSIKSIQIVSRLKQRGYTASIRDIMRYPIVEELCRLLKVSSRTIGQEIVKGRVSLGPIQEYFFENYGETPHQYNQSVLLRFRGKVSEEGLRTCLKKLVEHHDALRMVYYREGSDWVQENRGLEQGYMLEVLEGKSFSDLGEEADRMQSGIDIGTGPLFRAALWRMVGDDDDHVLLVAHHLVVDGVSWRILLEDLKLFYEQYQSGVPLSPALKTDSFRHWQERLREYAQGRWAEKEDAYWSNVKSEAVDAVVRDHAEGSNLTRDELSYSFLLDEAQTEQLQTGCYKAYRTEINDILLTGLGLSLEEIFGMRKILIGLEGHGREQIEEGVDTSRTVGWFTSMYPVVLDMGDSGEMVTRLIGVKERLHRVPNKGIGYGVLRYIGRRDYRLEPEIIFNYLGDFGGGGEGPQQQEEELFSFAGEYHGRNVPEGLKRAAVLVISGMVVGRRLRISIDYSREQYAPGTIERLSSVYRQKLEALIGVLSKEEQTWLSPVDLTYKGLSIEQLQLLDEDRRLQDVYPLSPLQQGLYYHWLHAPSSSVHFIQLCYRLKGAMEIDQLEKSYRLLVNRHAVLRTFFTHELGDTLLQVVQKDTPPGFVYEEVSDRAHFSMQDYRLQDRERGFDLHRGSQMRLTVLGMGDDSYEFIWSFHHILMDGWCVSILIKEFFEIYHALLSGREPELSRVHAYSEYIQWLNGVEREEVLGYWRNYLSGYDTVSGIPRGIADSVEQGYTGRELEFALDEGLRESIGRLCRETGVTENSFMQAVWGLLLSRYNDIDDVVFGSVVSGRPGELAGSEGMIGLFINTIPVRVRLRPEATVSELLREVQATQVAGEGNHYVQLADIQRETSLGRDLFDHIMAFENYPVEEMVEGSMKNSESGQNIQLLSTGIFERSNYDLSINIIPGKHLVWKFSYNANLYEEGQIRRLTEHLVRLMEGFVKDPGAVVGTISCMGVSEQEQLLKGFNDTAADFPKDRTVLDLFGQQAKDHSQAIAVTDNDTELTYEQLDQLSNQVARFLTKKGIQREDIVGLCMDRGVWMIVGMLGIIKSGAAYMPMDVNYPADRLEYMARDSAARLILTYPGKQGFFETMEEVEVVDILDDQVSAMSKEPVEIRLTGDQLAYVIYTSGSTGKPKGVMIEHASLVNLVAWHGREYEVSHSSRSTSTAGVGFDAFGWEIWPYLSAGARIYILDDNTRLSIDELISFYGDHHITHSFLSTGMVMEFVSRTGDKDLKLKYLLTGGDKLGRVDTSRSGYQLVNNYGPTENTVVATFYKLSGNGHENPPIGRPLSNVRIYILDHARRLMPVGITGELYIEGAQLARGYLHQKEMTADRFIYHRFEDGVERRLYRTGDLGRWDEKGNITYAGRTDDQVKIRGYRVELGEIEHVLAAYPGIQTAIVTLFETGGDTALAAYFVVEKDAEFDRDSLDEYLKEKLPNHMIPAHIIRLDALPFNENGKIDRNRLQPPKQTESIVEYIGPRNRIEWALSEMWKKRLNREKVGIRDDFFQLGGHSLGIVKMVAEIKDQFGVAITIESLFEGPTIEHVANEIQNLLWLKSSPQILSEDEFQEITI